MKTLLLSLIALAATSLGSFAQTTLHDVYLSIKDIPGMKVKNDQTVSINGIADVNEVRTASTTTTKNIDKLRGELMTLTENIPAEDIIASGDNSREFATIFVEPTDHNLYNLLVVQGNSTTGTFSATYGTTTDEDVEAITTGHLLTNGNVLVLTPTAGDTGTLITMAE